MNVFSGFDGMSCGQIALARSGHKVNNYYSAEIDKFAIQVTQANYPGTTQLGDIEQWREWDIDWATINLFIGGSPCQGFSFAGKQLNFSDPRSKLFFTWVDILNHARKQNPDILFMLENVNMKREYLRIISEYLGVFPVRINSRLVSAQNRDRWYWSNIRTKDVGLFSELWTDIPEPEDKGILLKDILQPENEIDQKYYLSDKMVNYMTTRKDNFNAGKINLKEGEDKASCINASSGSLDISDNIIKTDREGNIKADQDKAGALTVGGHGAGNHSDMDLIADFRFAQTIPTSIESDKHRALLAQCGGKTKGIGVYDNSMLRRLTPIECERLQTVPDKEIFCIFEICLDQIKNFVSVVNKNPRLQKLVGNAEKSELNESVKLVVKNMNVSSRSIKSTVQQNADMQTQRLTKKCTKNNPEEKNGNVDIVEKNTTPNFQDIEVDSVIQNVFINIIEGRITYFGKEELPPKDNNSNSLKNGKSVLKLSGKEIMQHVKDAEKSLTTAQGSNSISTILYPLNINHIEQILTIYYLFAKNVIIGYTPGTTKRKSISLNFNIVQGYTNHVSDSQRYKMLGNGWTVDVIAHIFSYL